MGTSSGDRQRRPRRRLWVLLLVSIVATSTASAKRARGHRLHRFEDYEAQVPHIVHTPRVEALTDLGAHVPQGDLAVRLQFPVGSRGRTATVDARIAGDFISDDYVETVYSPNGVVTHRSLEGKHRRCVHPCAA